MDDNRFEEGGLLLGEREWSLKTISTDLGTRGLRTTRRVEAGEIIFTETSCEHFDSLQPSHDTKKAERELKGGVQNQKWEKEMVRKYRDDHDFRLRVHALPGWLTVTRSNESKMRELVADQGFCFPSTSTLAAGIWICLPPPITADATSYPPLPTLQFGLWPHAGLIKHQCFGNAYRSFKGNVMTVRATRPIEKDTEITWSYQQLARPKRERVTEFLNERGIHCDCAICEHDRPKDPEVIRDRSRIVREHRELLKKALSWGMGLKKWRLNVTDSYLNALSESYSKPASEVPRLAHYELFAQILDLAWDPKHGQGFDNTLKVSVILDALKSVYFVIERRGNDNVLVLKQWGFVSPCTFKLFILLRNTYASSGNDLLAQEAERHAKMLYKITFGEDETFDVRRFQLWF